HWLHALRATKGIRRHLGATNVKEIGRPRNDATRWSVSGLHLQSSQVISEGDGTRTRNHRIDSRVIPQAVRHKTPEDYRHFTALPPVCKLCNSAQTYAKTCGNSAGRCRRAEEARKTWAAPTDQLPADQQGTRVLCHPVPKHLDRGGCGNEACCSRSRGPTPARVLPDGQSSSGSRTVSTGSPAPPGPAT